MTDLTAVRGDITRQHVDAIVNAANNAMRGGGGVDGAIHRAGGPAVLEDCVRRFPDGLATGDAGWTTAGELPARWVIHTVGPNYTTGERDRALLESCYRRALDVADDIGARTVAFPLISAGVYGWPRQDAIRAAVETLSAAQVSVEGVHLVAFSDEVYQEISAELEAWTTIRILQGVEVLHRRGYQRTRIVAAMAPSGLYWRVSIAPAGHLIRPAGEPLSASRISYSTGARTAFADAEVTINTSPDDVADIMLRVVPDLADAAEDPEYVSWYAGLMSLVKNPRDLPVGAAEYFDGTAGWEIGWGSGIRYPQPPGY